MTVGKKKIIISYWCHKKSAKCRLMQRFATVFQSNLLLRTLSRFEPNCKSLAKEKAPYDAREGWITRKSLQFLPSPAFLMAKFLKNEVHYKVNANFASRKAKYWFWCNITIYYTTSMVQQWHWQSYNCFMVFWLVTFFAAQVENHSKNTSFYPIYAEFT